MSAVHIVGPAGVSDPARPSGGNTYHRRMCAGLRALGWTTREWLVEGCRPGEERVPEPSMTSVLSGLEDGALVLLDGLVASPLPDVIAPQAGRLRLVVVVHLPLGLDSGGSPALARRKGEAAVLHAAAAVVTTSRWTRDWLLTTYRLQPGRVHIVSPGVDPAAMTEGSAAGMRLLVVGPVTSTKGHDVLVEALGEVADLAWSCRCAGSVDVDGEFADRSRRRVRHLGLEGRLVFTGPLDEGALGAEYAAADLLIAPSRTETYGMAVTEALARAVPVVCADVGGLPEALGYAPGGRRPGVLVTPADPASLATVLRGWLTDAGLREGLRVAARARRATLDDWSVTTTKLSDILGEVAA